MSSAILAQAHGNAMRRRSIEFDHRAVAFLADEGDMGDRHDVAAMHPDEQAGVACASASEIDHGHIRSRVPSWTLV